MSQPGRQCHIAGAVGAAPQVIDLRGVAAPIAFTLAPEPGNDLRVEFSLSPNAAALPAAAVWIFLHETIAAAPTSDMRIAPVAALRFTRLSGTGAGNRYEVLA